MKTLAAACLLAALPLVSRGRPRSLSPSVPTGPGPRPARPPWDVARCRSRPGWSTSANASAAARATDFGPGAKYRFLDPAEDSWRPALALLPFVTLPVNEPPIGTGKTDFGSLLLASFALPGQVSLDVNAGLAAIGQTRPAGYLLQAIVAAGASRDVAEQLTLFSDVFYTSRDERASRDSVVLDAGLIWRPTRHVALDASGVTSLAGPGPDWAVRAGVSVRLGR